MINIIDKLKTKYKKQFYLLTIIIKGGCWLWKEVKISINKKQLLFKR